MKHVTKVIIIIKEIPLILFISITLTTVMPNLL